MPLYAASSLSFPKSRRGNRYRGRRHRAGDGALQIRGEPDGRPSLPSRVHQRTRCQGSEPQFQCSEHAVSRAGAGRASHLHLLAVARSRRHAHRDQRWRIHSGDGGSFNGVPAQYNVLSPMAIDAIVPAGARSGPVIVTIAVGEAPTPSRWRSGLARRGIFRWAGCRGVARKHPDATGSSDITDEQGYPGVSG
ncbi:MAG: hypothetical protein JWQ98_1263 [Chlorobi bacterium]|nr:hypothetical protein [Chlorobiota bacterium]